MGISLRDERGQGIVEYILLLVVIVGIALGGLYQLNSAFKGWATNYFGNYIACLMETGELPAISASPGDSSICKQFFKPFSLAEGFALRTQGGGGSRSVERPNFSAGQGSNRGSRGGGGGSFGEGPAFRGGSGGSKSQVTQKPGAAKTSPTNTGNTNAVSYGAIHGTDARKGSSRQIRLDNSFAFDDGRDGQGGRKVGSVAMRSADYSLGKAVKVPLHQKKQQKDAAADDSDNSFSISNLIRVLIIIAIVIALVMFLGGQALQIGKSMES